jgi:hypothetical protein
MVKAALPIFAREVFNSFVEKLVEKGRQTRERTVKHCASCSLHNDEAFVLRFMENENFKRDLSLKFGALRTGVETLTK